MSGCDGVWEGNLSSFPALYSAGAAQERVPLPAFIPPQTNTLSAALFWGGGSEPLLQFVSPGCEFLQVEAGTFYLGPLKFLIESLDLHQSN